MGLQPPQTVPLTSQITNDVQAYSGKLTCVIFRLLLLVSVIFVELSPIARHARREDFPTVLIKVGSQVDVSARDATRCDVGRWSLNL